MILSNNYLQSKQKMLRKLWLTFSPQELPTQRERSLSARERYRGKPSKIYSALQLIVVELELVMMLACSICLIVATSHFKTFDGNAKGHCFLFAKMYARERIFIGGHRMICSSVIYAQFLTGVTILLFLGLVIRGREKHR